ncbi:unnamed protein product [Microthlaspi erraticum]|uniref:Reverse transcriptase domain-containing protein n=1 Tax=Microthlaspi erraticum TaxID=1685480 RepID=A0A6D2J669_9BRAS
MYRVTTKLKALKSPIRKFSRENFLHIEKRKKEAHELMLVCQKRLLDRPSVFNANQEIEAQRKWAILAQAEEAFHCQKSRVTWLMEGDCNSASFHRPDGYSAEFFIGCWNVLGAEVREAVMEFLTSGRILKQWNSTLVLIPKTTNASSTSDFRPISCLNTAYKVISKLLANRLQGILSKVISNPQSAFMLGRLIAENVLLATEIVHGYNWRNIEPRGMLKVYVRKAFDSVRWDFILATLKAIDIPQRFVIWIEQCITTASFTVSVNGNSGGFFKSTK